MGELTPCPGKMAFRSRLSSMPLKHFEMFFSSAERDSSAVLQANRTELYRTNSIALSLSSLFLISIALIFNISEGNESLYLPLVVSDCVILACLAYIGATGKGFVPILVNCLTLMSIGVYLLLFYDRGVESKLFWFILFPPMLMLCLGLRYGSLIFVLFFLFLLAVMVGPLTPYLSYEYPAPVRFRFLAVFFGSFFFSCFSEYARSRTQKELWRALDRLERESLTDPLTGLGNRRDFQNFFTWLQAKSIREKRPFCIALIDIDHFKKINDRHGHEAGDAVLRHTAQMLIPRMRAGDRLFRWGGEEFVILMPETTCTEARNAMERLRGEIECSPCDYDAECIGYTISVGLHCGEATEAMREQVAAADSMLYKAKRSGRNQVQCLPEQEQSAALTP